MIMNRFKELNYIDEKSIEVLISKIIVIKLKWKNLKIIENEFFVFKLFNILNSNFETYLIILFNEKVRKNKNLLNLNTLIIRLKQEEYRMQIQEKQINALHYHIENRNFRESREDRDQNKKDKNIKNKHDDNDNNNDEFDDFCFCYYINHKLSTYKYCLHKNIIYFNDKHKKRNHQFKNYYQKDDNIHKKKNSKKNKFDKNDKTFKTFMRHIVSVKIFINNLMINYYNFYILNLKAIHHCSKNKTLFKNLRIIHEVIKTINDEILKIKIINNIKIFLLNDEFLILSKIMYISNLMMNLIVISRLWHKDFDILYLID